MNIPDPNFRLTLLDSLWTANLAPRFDRDAFFRDVLKEPYDFMAPYNDAVHEGVRQALLQEPITEDQLAKLTFLQWDGGDEIHSLIWENWDGEDETFDVRDLTGIEHCPALEWIEFTSGSQVTDLSPLSGLKSLGKLMLFGSPVAQLEPLEKLPALRKLSLRFVDNPESRQLLAKLEARGVDLSGCLAR